MKVFLSAGEVSGDIVGARLASELLQRNASIDISGVGGEHMRGAGVRVLADANHLGTIGVTESFRVIPSLLSVWRKISADIACRRPDVAVLIGNDIFNVLLGRSLRARGIHVVSLFPPQIWIWRSLAWLFARSYDTILTCFTDEEKVWSRHGRSTVFVGHHLADALDRVAEGERVEARRSLGLAEKSDVLAVLPGSRAQELSVLLPIFVEAAKGIADSCPAVRFVIPVAEAVDPERMRDEFCALGDRVLVTGDSHAALRAADLALLASGTATLEAALLGIPMIVAYRISRASMAIVRLCIRMGLIDSETLALPNLLLRRDVVPEFHQESLSAEALSREAIRLMSDAAARAAISESLRDVRAHVYAGGSIRAAADRVLRAAEAAERAPVRRGVALAAEEAS